MAILSTYVNSSEVQTVVMPSLISLRAVKHPPKPIAHIHWLAGVQRKLHLGGAEIDNTAKSK